MIEVLEVKQKKDFIKFIKFPFELYKDNKYWVPPIISEELETFNKDINPSLIEADAKYFLAYKNKKLVGRVAVILNWKEIKEDNDKKIRFGWFDFIDDKTVSEALLNKVKEVALQERLEYIEGPMGFNNLDKVGVMTEGFEQEGSMVTWYNHPYYIDHYNNFGLEVSKEYIESKFYFSNVDPTGFTKISSLIERRYGLKTVHVNTKKELMVYIDQMFDLFNLTYSKLESYTTISDDQREYYKKKFISFVDPKLIKFIVDKDGKLISFSIVLPSFAKALKKANGKLFPFGFLHFLKAKKKYNKIVFYLIGVDPEYQNKGVTAIIFNEYYKIFKDSKASEFYRTPELASNEAIQKIWKNFDPKICVRRQTMKYNL